MRNLNLPVIVLAFGGLWLSPLSAQIPQLLHYQGRIVSGATNFDGAGLFKFALVGTNQSGSVATLWSNNGSSSTGNEPSAPVNIPVVKGLYAVLLGDTAMPNMTAIPAVVFNNPAVWLRVWFNDGVRGFQQITPDQRIAAVGYAMTAGNVPDGVITPQKMSPGVTGQILMTDTSGRAIWAPATDLSPYLTQEQLNQASVNPEDNTATIAISDLMTNEVVIVGGLSIELALEAKTLPWTSEPGVPLPVLEVPPRYGFASHSKFVFEFSGIASNLLIADLTSTNEWLDRTINIYIKNSLGVEKCRWTLPNMELEKVQPGTQGRLRYTYRPDQAVGYADNVPEFVRTPEISNPENCSTRPGYENQHLYIAGVGCFKPDDMVVDTRNRTVTLTVGHEDMGNLFFWLKSMSMDVNSGLGVDYKQMSIITYKKDNNGIWMERFRNNYFEVMPIRFEVPSGFKQFEKLKERIVLKYRYRERA